MSLSLSTAAPSLSGPRHFCRLCWHSRHRSHISIICICRCVMHAHVEWVARRQSIGRTPSGEALWTPDTASRRRALGKQSAVAHIAPSNMAWHGFSVLPGLAMQSAHGNSMTNRRCAVQLYHNRFSSGAMIEQCSSKRALGEWLHKWYRAPTSYCENSCILVFITSLGWWKENTMDMDGRSLSLSLHALALLQRTNYYAHRSTHVCVGRAFMWYIEFAHTDIVHIMLSDCD